jgi:hypothetical protein
MISFARYNSMLIIKTTNPCIYVTFANKNANHHESREHVALLSVNETKKNTFNSDGDLASGEDDENDGQHGPLDPLLSLDHFFFALFWDLWNE